MTLYMTHSPIHHIIHWINVKDNINGLKRSIYV